MKDIDFCYKLPYAKIIQGSVQAIVGVVCSVCNLLKRIFTKIIVRAVGCYAVSYFS